MARGMPSGCLSPLLDVEVQIKRGVSRNTPCHRQGRFTTPCIAPQLLEQRVCLFVSCSSWLLQHMALITSTARKGWHTCKQAPHMRAGARSHHSPCRQAPTNNTCKQGHVQLLGA